VKFPISNHKLQIVTVSTLLLLALVASAQVSSHAPTAVKPATVASAPGSTVIKPVARVNGAVLTEADLLRQMYAIFPYARQHNGFPKSMEREIRQGALQMIIFEELLYQDAKRRKLSVLPSRLSSAESRMRKQFPTEAGFRQYLQSECNGSLPAFREKIRRSLLIEQMLQTEVTGKSKVTLADAKAFYEKNAKQFVHGETFHLQTISILPPQNGDAEVHKEARKRAEEALRQAKASKNYQEFGLLAEKMSDDDWHVNMGDRKPVEPEKFPPQIVKAARAMKPGQVSELIQLGNAYTIFRLVAHTPAGKTPFSAVKDKLRADLEKEKLEKVRSTLGATLRKSASIEVL
jgi:hypothetical protein